MTDFLVAHVDLAFCLGTKRAVRELINDSMDAMYHELGGQDLLHGPMERWGEESEVE